MREVSTTINGHRFVIRYDDHPASLSAALTACYGLACSDDPDTVTAGIVLFEQISRPAGTLPA